jgi:hypothetical protein
MEGAESKEFALWRAECSKTPGGCFWRRARMQGGSEGARLQWRLVVEARGGLIKSKKIKSRRKQQGENENQANTDCKPW